MKSTKNPRNEYFDAKNMPIDERKEEDLPKKKKTLENRNDDFEVYNVYASIIFTSDIPNAQDIKTRPRKVD